jgi:hypothetical protein
MEVKLIERAFGASRSNSAPFHFGFPRGERSRLDIGIPDVRYRRLSSSELDAGISIMLADSKSHGTLLLLIDALRTLVLCVEHGCPLSSEP